jgi:hypothetical protein
MRTLLIAMAVCGLVFSGCGKKPKQAQVQNVPQVPEPAAVAPSAPAKTDTGDVFKEFSKKGSKEAEGKGNKKAIAPESYTPEFSDNGRYVVQIAAASARTAADELAAAFKGKGYPAYVVEVQNPTPALQGTYYRVRIGGFAMLADAKAFGENILRQANYDYWVDLKSNEGMTYGNPLNQSTSAPYSTSTPSTFTPAPAPAPASTNEPASTPVYTPTPASTPSTSTPPSTSTETNWNASSSAPAATSSPATTSGSSVTTPTTPAASTTPEPPATTPSTSTGSSWTSGSSSAPATESQTTPPTQSTESTQPAATTPPASSTDTSKSWGGGWK